MYQKKCAAGLRKSNCNKDWSRNQMQVLEDFAHNFPNLQRDKQYVLKFKDDNLKWCRKGLEWKQEQVVEAKKGIRKIVWSRYPVHS